MGTQYSRWGLTTALYKGINTSGVRAESSAFRQKSSFRAQSVSSQENRLEPEFDLQILAPASSDDPTMLRQ